MSPRVLAWRTLLVVCVLIAADRLLAHHLAQTDPLVEATRGSSATIVGMLALLLTTRLVGIFVLPSWLVYRVYRWGVLKRAMK